VSAANRLRIFIDGGYLFKVFDPYRAVGYRFSCKRLIRLLGTDYNLLGVHYVNSINTRKPAIKKKQEGFYYGYLRGNLGWEVTILPLQWPGGEAQQKGTDSVVTLQLHDLAVRNAYDVAILLAADSDFVPPVNLVKAQGKIVRNAYFSARPSFHLQQACNGALIRLDDLDFVFKDGEPFKLLRLADLKIKKRR
jgi:uncharacterized LabA/DUF88 family protein